MQLSCVPYSMHSAGYDFCRLTHLKNIYSKQLPNMPKEYIARLVFERRHRSVGIVNSSNNQCIGGITYRTFPGTSCASLGEIAFCAVSATHQVKGHGTRLMNWTKEHARTQDKLSHFLTYADNNAVGYFAKQVRTSSACCSINLTTIEALVGMLPCASSLCRPPSPQGCMPILSSALTLQNVVNAHGPGWDYVL